MRAIEITSLPYVPSSENVGYLRASVQLGFPTGHIEIVWFDVSEGRYIASSSNHWLILGFLLAYKQGTNLRIAGQTDELLLQNIKILILS